jgi:hypothetical protein
VVEIGKGEAALKLECLRTFARECGGCSRSSLTAHGAAPGWMRSAYSGSLTCST